MNVFRIVSSAFKDDLSGGGAALYGGRWNSKGNTILYCTEHISLAVLEIAVNYNKATSPLIPNYHLLEIEAPDVKQVILRLSDLKKDWRDDIHYSQFIGDEFLKDNSHLILKVPSAVIPEEHNFLLNPQHKDFKKVKILRSKTYNFDDRLFT